MWLKHLSKFTCFSTFFLIFVGGMVTSTGSGLAVPDWPLSYGTLFPPMIGGVFYEHGHRMVASFVGLCMLILAIWIIVKDQRKWLKIVGAVGLFAVILQGVLGGLTVLFFLPTAISVSHGILAQTFFLITIFIAYSLSDERSDRDYLERKRSALFLKVTFSFLILIYIQLLLGAIMRHTHSGLAIYDFPTVGGKWLPLFDDELLYIINSWRFDNDFDPVKMGQIIIHFSHRIGALFICIAICFVNVIGLKYYKDTTIRKTIYALDTLIILQILLGVMTIFTLKSPIITSLHVVIGASILGVTFLLILRSSPLTCSGFKRLVSRVY